MKLHGNFRRRWVAASLAISAAFGLASASLAAAPGGDATAEPAENAAGEASREGVDAGVGRLLAIGDAVLARHIDPPTRQEMVLGAVRALYRQMEAPLPAGMSSRISGLADADSLRTLLSEVWSAAPVSEKVDRQQQEQAMIEGMLAVVPGGAEYVSAKEARVRDQLRANRYVGIGVALGFKDGPLLMKVFPNGPAAAAGARQDDRILSVDGVSVEGKKLTEVVDMLRGEEGTEVAVVVRGKSKADESRTLTMTRGVVPIASVHGSRGDDSEESDYRANDSRRIAYVEIDALKGSTLHELRLLERRLVAKGFQAIVLDLRSTVQGSLHDAVMLADGLLPEGPIGRVEDHRGVREFHSKPDALFRDWPLAVLVNQNTRGEIEWLAAALQDQRRAIVIGEPTAGQGYVRESVELPDNQGAITLRTGRLLRGDGRSLIDEERAARLAALSIARPIGVRPRPAAAAPVAPVAPGAPGAPVAPGAPGSASRESYVVVEPREGTLHPGHVIGGMATRYENVVDPVAKAVEELREALKEE